MSGFASFANIVSNNLAGHQPAQSWMLSCSRSLYSTARLFLFRFQTLPLLLQFDEICLILSLKRIDRPRRFVVAFNSRIYPQIGHVLPTQKRVHDHTKRILLHKAKVDCNLRFSPNALIGGFKNPRLFLSMIGVYLKQTGKAKIRFPLFPLKDKNYFYLLRKM